MKYYLFEGRKKRLVLLLCLIVIIVPLSSLTMAQSTRVQAGDQIEYTYSFDEPTLKTVAMQGQDFCDLQLDHSLSISDHAGAPVYPVVPVRLLLPQRTKVAFIEVTVDTKELDPLKQGIDLQETVIRPYQEPVPLGTSAPVFAFDTHTYQSSEPVPAALYENVGVGYCRGYAILTLNLHPTEYLPAEGTISYHPEMKVIVHLETTSTAQPLYRPGNSDDRAWVASLVQNPDVIDTYTDPLPMGYEGGLCDPSDNDGLGYDYVVIVREALYEFTGTPYTWDDFISRKQAEGLETTKVMVEDILACEDYWNDDQLFDDTPARIREFCRDAYQDWGTQYILIAGDNDNYNPTTKIERREMDSNGENNVESDIYWTHLDNTFNADHDSYWGEESDNGFDLYSEMYSGSLPCDTKYDISNWMKKSFYYADSVDLAYLDNAAFYAGDLGWTCQGDDFIEYSAIQGTDDYLGPNPHAQGPYPSWLGFQYGFETWNSKHPEALFDISVRWTEEPPNPEWLGGPGSGMQGMRNAINNDQCTLISAIAHADPSMSMDVYYTDWEASYHNTRPFFLYDWGCHCGDMNYVDDGILHSMLFHSDTELAFACIYNTGYGWGEFDCTNSSSSVMQKSFYDYLFDVDNNSGNTANWQLGKAHEWARDNLAPTINWGWNGYLSMWRATIQCCLLFGDPAQTIKAPMLSIPGDINGDGVVNTEDLLMLLGAWGNPGGPEDINGDGIVNTEDLLILLGNWGQIPLFLLFLFIQFDNNQINYKYSK